MKNLQEKVKKAFCYLKLFWPFTVWINCSSDLKNFANSRLEFQKFFSNTRTIFSTVSQYNFDNKIPDMCIKHIFYSFVIFPFYSILVGISFSKEYILKRTILIPPYNSIFHVDLHCMYDMRTDDLFSRYFIICHRMRLLHDVQMS